NLGTNPATSVSAIIFTPDEFITINQNESDYGNIGGSSFQTNFTDFNISVSENCPDGYIAEILVNVMSNENNWELYFNIELNAPIIDLESVLVNDGQNSILDPGETAEIVLLFENSGGASGYEIGTLIFLNDPYITLNSSEFFIGDIDAGNISSGIFNLSAATNAPVGHIVNLDWIISGELNYSNEGDFSLTISQIPVLINEDFNSFPPDGWEITSSSGSFNWGGSYSNHAGSSPPEAQFSYYPSTTAVQRLQILPLNTAGSSTLELEFSHSINNYTGNYEIRLETTGDGNTWNTVTTWPSSNLPATTENITISTSDVGSPTFQFAFTFDGDSFGINRWSIDDVLMENGNSQNLGYFAGNVNLLGGSGNVKDVTIFVNTQTAHPNQDGEYIMPLIPDSYDIRASLYGYQTEIITNQEVIANQTTNCNFELELLNIPANLIASVSTNDVTLEWDAPTDFSDESLPSVLKDGNKNLRSNKQKPSETNRS
ncbi:MAG: choice-of-anchor J domain-containing protein, partial [Candidatus Cloacimonadota bacterium]|nr:choice-of-anchor J domain-containing protein [Candidatus Cloacimonadota bacterium]